MALTWWVLLAMTGDAVVTHLGIRAQMLEFSVMRKGVFGGMNRA